MKYVKQFLIILLISFIGEGLNYLIPAPVPASIYGMVILFVCLCTKVVKLDDVKDTGMFLIEIMPLMFIPAGVGLMKSWGVLKPLVVPVLVGILSGVLTSLTTIMILAFIFKLSHKEYVTMLPKSITTAIGIGVSEELGGYVTITVAVIILTGVLGNILAEGICKLFKINHPIAKGIAIGTASHAIGTAKAMELGEIEGAMSSLSIAVSGILTVVGSIGFAKII